MVDEIENPEDELDIEVKMTEPDGQGSQLSEIQEKLKSDVDWLYLICPLPPKPEEVEYAVQAFSILQCVNSRISQLDKFDFARLAIAGWLAAKARKADEERFQTLDVFAFFNVAYAWTDPTDTEGVGYGEFINRIHPLS